MNSPMSSNSAMREGSTIPKSITEVSTELNYLECVINDLGSDISKLENNLSPVLRESLPQKSASEEEVELNTPLGKKIKSYTDRLKLFMEKIKELTNRLEI